MTGLRRAPRAILGLAFAALVACEGGPEGMKAPPGTSSADPAGVASKAVPVDSTPRLPADGVTVAGRVVAEESGSPVTGAYVVILQAGVPFERWESAAGEETEGLIRAAVRSDSTGRYRVPRLERGREYTVMIAARGYRSAAFDLGLTVEADAPAVKTMDPVTLEPGVW